MFLASLQLIKTKLEVNTRKYKFIMFHFIKSMYT